jgi:hypothetical protein
LCSISSTICGAASRPGKVVRQRKRDEASGVSLLAVPALAQNTDRDPLVKHIGTPPGIFTLAVAELMPAEASILVHVEQEDKPWFCSEWPDYIAFESSSTHPTALPTSWDRTFSGSYI